MVGLEIAYTLKSQLGPGGVKGCRVDGHQVADMIARIEAAENLTGCLVS